MAEGWARASAAQLSDPEAFSFSSAGLEAHGLNPRAVAVMAQNGVDISAHTSDILTDEMLAAADLVVSVCSHADTNCPLLPAGTAKRHLPFTDPAQATGPEADINACFESVCGEIRDAMADLIHELSANRQMSVRQDSDEPLFQQSDVEIQSQAAVFQGFLKVEKLHLRHQLFGGGWSERLERELLIKEQAVGVLLLDPDTDRLVMVRQFRAGMLWQPESPWPLELVAGMVDKEETLEAVALRETREETGLTASGLVKICEYFNSPGSSTEKVTLFCAKVDAEAAGGIHGLEQEHEDIKVVVLPREQALQRVRSGEINNAMSVIALQWLELNQKTLQKTWT
jgi:ADP-ribose pyrophosphatase